MKRWLEDRRALTTEAKISHDRALSAVAIVFRDSAYQRRLIAAVSYTQTQTFAGAGLTISRYRSNIPKPKPKTCGAEISSEGRGSHLW